MIRHVIWSKSAKSTNVCLSDNPRRRVNTAWENSDLLEVGSVAPLTKPKNGMLIPVVNGLVGAQDIHKSGKSDQFLVQDGLDPVPYSNKNVGSRIVLFEVCFSLSLPH